MRLVNYGGVRYLLTSDTDEAVGELNRQLPMIKADIQGMKDSQSGEQKWFHRQDSWDIKEVFGATTVTVYSKSGGKKYRAIKNYDRVSVVELIPYLLCPDGILLCGGGLNFNGPYTLKDPYEKGINNYFEPYAPYCFPITSNNIRYWWEDPPPTLNDEKLLEWQIKEFKENLGNIEYEYNEPDFYGVANGYCPAYWHSYAEYYPELMKYYDDWTYILPTIDYGFETDGDKIVDIENRTEPLLLSWGWSFFPAQYWYQSSYEENRWLYTISIFGSQIVEQTNSNIKEGAGTSGNYGGTAEEYWHIMAYPAPGGCPANPSIYYWEDCPSVGPWPGQGVYDSWNNDIWSGGSCYPIAKVSDLNSVWGLIYYKTTWEAEESLVIDYDAYYATPAGTMQNPYKTYTTHEETGIRTKEVRWKDSFGGDVLIDFMSGGDVNLGFYNNAYTRLYQVDGKNIFVFGYDRIYLPRESPNIVGISVDGNVTLTDVSGTIVAGDKSYSDILGGQFMGILKRSYTKEYTSDEIITEER